MAQKIITQRIELTRQDGRDTLLWPDVLAVKGDSHAHQWRVELYSGGGPADLMGQTAMCYVVNGGNSVPLNATIEGNTAWVSFPSACYAHAGTMYCMMSIGAGGQSPTVAMMCLRVRDGITDVIIDPDDIVPSLNALLALVAELADAATAETARILAEQARAAAETARQTNELERQSAETTRGNAETTRQTQEGQRQSAETARDSAETTRQTNELERQSAETTRTNAEDARQTQETQRQSAETARDSAETTRQTNELERQSAEAMRDVEIADARLGNTTVGMHLRGLRANMVPRNMAVTGKIYSVSFAAPSISMASAGTREDDAVSMVANPSTDTVAGANDFDKVSPFNVVRCNGYVDPSGEPIPTCFEGDPAFKLDGSNGDVWAYGITPWFKITINPDGSEKHSVSDRYHGAGWFPNPGSIRPDGSVRPYVMTSCYRGSLGSDGKVASISGKVPMYNVSHNSQLTACRAKGPQYCGYTSKDNFYLYELMMIEYATMNAQSVMTGQADCYYQYTAAIPETSVKRIVLTNAQAANFYPNMCVSIGYPSTLSGENLSTDRGVATMHGKADRVRITEITPLGDGVHTALEVDAAAAFDTTITIVNIGGTDYSAPCYISNMPNYTGMTDGVLGPSGSPRSNTNSKNDCRYRYIENPYGSQYMPLADVIKNFPSLFTCYLCEKFSTGVTGDYTAVGYELSAHTGWAYVTQLGFDPDNPSVRLGTVCTATSSTRHADGQYEDQVVAAREVLVSGYLAVGGNVGPACASLYSGLTHGWWYFGLRLSSTGRCGRVAAAA